MRSLLLILLALPASVSLALAQGGEVMICPALPTVAADSIRLDVQPKASGYAGAYLKMSLTCGRGDIVSNENLRIAAGGMKAVRTIATASEEVDCRKKKSTRRLTQCHPTR